MAFNYERRVSFSDTDAMGVVHHAKYLHYLEEARVEWMRARGLGHTHFPHSDRVLALLRYQVWHIKPAFFDDLLRVDLEVQGLKLKIHFQYAIYSGDTLIAKAETLHIPVDKDLKPVRPSPALLKTLENEAWTETWLSNW